MMASAPRSRRFLDHLVERHRLRLPQLLFVGPGAAADDVADAGEEVAENVGAHHRLAGDDAEIHADAAALYAVRGGDDHGSTCPLLTVTLITSR